MLFINYRTLKYLVSLLLICLVLSSAGQNLTQTIRGAVTDKETRAPLVGANVVILNTEPFQGTVTDADGRFRIENVKVGRRNIKVSFLGYEDYLISELEVISAKENVLNIEMTEKVFTSKEVVISGKQNKEHAVNEMSILSTRQFSVEETSKYAGAWGDPSRMASNFAGVTIVSDERNDIIVRGNSPVGVLWRMDGVQIPNPNHFAVAGSSGGAISMINNNLLDNSDFTTGAFAPEYGNAVSAVFDLKMRNGNNEKREYVFQLGMQGVELGTEGPFKKGKKSSYMVNYRYSTLTLLNLIGIRIVDAVPNFQDLSFKLNFPFKRGSISWFGIGGKSNATEKVKKDSTAWEASSDQIGYISGSQMAVSGLSWFQLIGDKTYMKLMLSGSVFNPFNIDDSMGYDYKRFELTQYGQTEYKGIVSCIFNTKITAKHVLRYGLIYNYLQSMNNSYYYTYFGGEQKHNVNDFSGNTSLMQGFVQWKYNIRDNLTLTTGGHALYLFLNGRTSIEPRAALRWGIGAHAISFGFGMHGMMQPTAVYYADVPDGSGGTTMPNKKLGFTKAFHYVLGYDWMITENIRLKLESYYQDMRKVPVSINQPTLSLLNFGTDDNIFIQSEYRNTGMGKNYGIEITAEKFFNKGSYFLFTGSLFNSQYRDGNGKWRNTRYNSNYAANFLAGKEFKMGKKKNHILGINTTIVYIAGQRYTPIDLDASNLAGYAVYVDSLAYSKRIKDFFKIDLRIRFRFNTKHFSHELAIEAANILNRKNIQAVFYNRNTGKIDYSYDLSLIPLLFYKLMF
jgi:hypothetical protein